MVLIDSIPIEDVPDSIRILPPTDKGAESDTESRDEDLMDCDINRLSKTQLITTVVIE